LVETHLDFKSRSVVKIDVCTLTSMANVRILDERRPTREKRKGDEVLCMTKLDALTIILSRTDPIPVSVICFLNFVSNSTSR